MTTFDKVRTAFFVAFCILAAAAFGEWSARADATAPKAFQNRLGDGSEFQVAPTKAPLMEGFTREKKGRKLPITRVIENRAGIMCSDRGAAAYVAEALRNGPLEALKEAAEMTHGLCVWYDGLVNFATGSIKEGEVADVIRDPATNPRPAFFVAL